MASAIDMSARMISLAVNISLMGFILVEGVQSSLRRMLPGALDASVLRALAERIAAAGVAIPHERKLPDAIVHKALVDGFESVMLYGGLCVWVLAGVSSVIFNAGASIDVADDPGSAKSESSAT